MKELKLHGERQEDFLSSLEGAADHQRREQIRANTIFAFATAWGQLLFFLVVGGLLLARPYLPGVGRESLMSYIVVMIYMMAPLQAVLNSLPQLSRADVSVKRIEELGLSLEPRDGERYTGESVLVQPDWHTLQLEGITHSYRGESEHERFTLGPMDLTFHPGELVILAGGNGSGKTTLAKLLLGLYEPESGRLLLDGEPIGDHNRDSYRQRFTAVFSDFYLFEELLGLKSDGVDDRARFYLEKLQIAGKVSVQDGMLSTTALSQGQRKRLALLTAYLEDRPICVFDEWAADQDPVFKRLFYETLLPELKGRGKTVIAISHDDHYYGVADRLVKLDYGQKVYDGQVEERPVVEAVG
jgi:putative ATP-binding cassette transporter